MLLLIQGQAGCQQQIGEPDLQGCEPDQRKVSCQVGPFRLQFENPLALTHGFKCVPMPSSTAVYLQATILVSAKACLGLLWQTMCSIPGLVGTSSHYKCIAMSHDPHYALLQSHRNTKLLRQRLWRDKRVQKGITHWHTKTWKHNPKQSIHSSRSMSHGILRF